jgi:gallate dioxygenase
VAAIVLGAGMPHTPVFPALVQEQPGSDTARLYDRVAAELRASRPDVLVLFGCDHINAFFLDNWPTFCIATAAEVVGPSDDPPLLEPHGIPVASGLARHVLRRCVEDSFDLSFSEELRVDHSVAVPLHFLDPGHAWPVLPIFVNGFVAPLPTARRCHALGRAVRRAVEDWPDRWRVAVVASGAFSLEVAGPRSAPGALWGIPDRGWAERVCDHLAASSIDRLLEEATEARMLQAGNAAGELLAWVAMLGCAGHLGFRFLELPEGQGHAFAVWRDPEDRR